MDSYLISINKFGSFKNPFATITSLSKLHFKCTRFILLVKIIFTDSNELWQQKPLKWLRYDLMYKMKDIYINSHRNQLLNSAVVTATPSLKTFSQGTSHKLSQRLSQSLRNYHKLCDKKEHPICVWRASTDTEAKTWSEYCNAEKATAGQILGSEERNPKVGLWQSKSGIWVKTLTIWVRSTEMEKLKLSLSHIEKKYQENWIEEKIHKQQH